LGGRNNNGGITYIRKGEGTNLGGKVSPRKRGRGAGKEQLRRGEKSKKSPLGRAIDIWPLLSRKGPVGKNVGGRELGEKRGKARVAGGGAHEFHPKKKH